MIKIEMKMKRNWSYCLSLAILVLCVFLSFSEVMAAEFSLIVESEGHQAIIHSQKAEKKGRGLGSS